MSQQATNTGPVAAGDDDDWIALAAERLTDDVRTEYTVLRRYYATLPAEDAVHGLCVRLASVALFSTRLSAQLAEARAEIASLGREHARATRAADTLADMLRGAQQERDLVQATEAAAAIADRFDRDTTHHPECWREHHACAVAVLERPVVTHDPAMRWGRATVRGISTSALFEQVAAGASTGEVADDYGLTRHGVLLACWWEALHGRRTSLTQGWRAWAREVEWELAAADVDPAAVPDPPVAGDA